MIVMTVTEALMRIREDAENIIQKREEVPSVKTLETLWAMQDRLSEVYRAAFRKYYGPNVPGAADWGKP